MKRWRVPPETRRVGVVPWTFVCLGWAALGHAVSHGPSPPRASATEVQDRQSIVAPVATMLLGALVAGRRSSKKAHPFASMRSWSCILSARQESTARSERLVGLVGRIGDKASNRSRIRATSSMPAHMIRSQTWESPPRTRFSCFLTGPKQVLRAAVALCRARRLR